MLSMFVHIATYPDQYNCNGVYAWLNNCWGATKAKLNYLIGRCVNTPNSEPNYDSESETNYDSESESCKLLIRPNIKNIRQKPTKKKFRVTKHDTLNNSSDDEYLIV